MKFLMMMGITYEMLVNHIKETSTFPETIYRGNNFFKTWNELFNATMSK